MRTASALARSHASARAAATLPLLMARREAEANRTATAIAPVGEYAGSSFEFITQVLHVAPHTLRWSDNPAYANHQWDGTPDPLMAILDALDRGEKRIAVEAAIGTQKTYTVACAALAFLAKWPGATVVTLAPKEEQLAMHLWKEIERLWPAFQARYPAAARTSLYVQRQGGTDTDGRIVGYGAAVKAGEKNTSATKAQGFHDEHLLFIYEEMPGIHESLIAATDSSCVAPHNLQLGIGNPDSKQDSLHRMAVRSGATHIRISAHDHPNVVTGDDRIVIGAVTKQSLADRAIAYGGEDSLFYRSRARGISPDESSHSLIKRTWLEIAAAKFDDDDLRWDVQGRMKNPKPKALGIDVANVAEGDKAAISHWQGDVCVRVESLHVGEGHELRDCNVLGTYVVGLARSQDIPPERVGVDSVGVGAGTVNEMRRLRFPCEALGGAETPVRQSEQEEKFQNLRAQMWWQAREDLRTGAIAICRDPELWEDLVEVGFTTKGGKILVDPKDEITRRLGRSPDKGDAFVYGNWVRMHRKPRSIGALTARF
jgi:hypothetical protein